MPRASTAATMRRELTERPLDAARRRLLGGRGQQLRRPGQLGEATREIDGGLGAASGAQHDVQPGAVALGDATPRLFQRRPGEPQRGEHLARQAEVAEIDGRPHQADRRQRLDAERDHLGVTLGAGQARQLDAGLGQLALAAPRAIEAHHGPLVAKAHRAPSLRGSA